MTVDLDRAYWLGLLVSVVLPVRVGLVTTRVTHPGTKAVLLLALSTANGFVVEYAAPGPGYSVGAEAVVAFVTFGTGVLSRFGFWQPVGVAGRAHDSFTKAA